MASYKFGSNSDLCLTGDLREVLPGVIAYGIQFDLNLYLLDTAKSYVKYNAVNTMNRIMERATIIVDGLVQGVGFRYKVRAGAVSLGVTGYVKNLDDETVEIVAEGSKQDIESLIQKMRNFGEPVVVKGIKVSRQKATGEFRSFRIVVGDMLAEMVEGFDTGNMHFEISHRKQDQLIATIQGYSEKMLDKQDQTSSEVRRLSDNLGNMMDRRFQRLDGEIRLIKGKIGI